MKKVSLEDALARELLVVGYIAARQTGFRPSNLRRSIRNVKFTKIIYTVIFSFYIALFSLFTSFKQIGFGVFAASMLIFAMSGLSVSSMMTPLSYAIYGSNNIRDFLLSTSLDAEQIHRLVGKAIFKTVDYIIYGTFGVSLIMSIIFKEFYILFSVAMGLSLGMLLQLAALELSYIRSKSMASSVATRSAVSLLPIVFLIPIFLSGTLYRLNLSSISSFYFIPPLSAAFGNSLHGAITSFFWITVFGYGVYRLIPDVSWKLISGPPSAFFPILTKKVSNRWKITSSKTLALLRADFQAASRSLLGALIGGPLIVFLVILMNGAASSASSLNVLSFTLGVEMAYLSIMIPYAFYAMEMRGASALRMLPLSKVKIALPKLLLLLITYFLYEGSLTVVMLIKHASILNMLPFLLGFFGPAASIPMTGIIFEETLKSGGSPTVTLSIAFFLISAIIVAVPYTVYFIMTLFRMGYFESLLAMIVTGALEFSILMFILSLYD
ncbi:MAG: hypothetical protein ACP5FU_04055 [Nitrososphaeria archaeon]